MPHDFTPSVADHPEDKLNNASLLLQAVVVSFKRSSAVINVLSAEIHNEIFKYFEETNTSAMHLTIRSVLLQIKHVRYTFFSSTKSLFIDDIIMDKLWNMPKNRTKNWCTEFLVGRLYNTRFRRV